MQGYAKQLTDLGYRITSRWINGGHDTVDATHDNDKSRYAVEDITDLFDAFTVINFTEPPGEIQGRGRGGRHVELGLALANYYNDSGMHPILQRVIVVGHRENVFHWLPEVEFYSTWDECLAVLTKKARA